MGYKRFEELPVWQSAVELALKIFALASSSDWRAPSGLRNQLERAVLSISNNIAEGFERGTNQELLTFLYIARGSTGEVRSMLCVLERLPDLHTLESEIRNVKSLSLSISRQLGGWIESIKNSGFTGTRSRNDATRQTEESARKQAAFLEELRRIQADGPGPQPDHPLSTQESHSEATARPRPPPDRQTGIIMIYLDNAATSFPKPDVVYETMDRFARTSLGNPGRSGHRMATGSEKVLDDARWALNRFFNGEDPKRWIFTLNCTDALNIAIKGAVGPGDHVITSDLEHNSVSRPLRRLEKDGVIELTRLASHDGYLDPEEVRAALRPNTKLVALTHASNVLGTVQPIEAIGAIARTANALFLVDAAQSAGVVPIDLKTQPIDLLAFPGHKALYGPTGTGSLYVGPRARLRAWREGGTGGDSKKEVQPEELPHFLEGGTPNILGVAGLAAGTAWVAERGPDVNRRHEVELLQKVVDWVEGSSDGWRYAGRWDPETHVGALSLISPDPDVFPSQDLALALDSGFEIAVRAGLHCAPYIHQRLGTFPDGTLRLSPGPFNTAEEIDTFLNALTEITAGVL